jgi:hypothetical protein
MLSGAKHPATSMLISLRKRLKISSHYLITELVEVAGFFASLRMTMESPVQSFNALAMKSVLHKMSR